MFNEAICRFEYTCLASMEPEIMGTMQSDYLMDVILKLSRSRSVEGIVDIVRHAARKLTGADGATFILKDQDKCYYVDEDAIGPLWKGKRFPLEDCISGWTMLNKRHTVIRDIYKDPRIPINAYRATFVKSLVMVPINIDSPIGAIGNYWAQEHEATEDEVGILTFLAEVTSVAVQNVEVLDQLENSLSSSKDQKKSNDEYMAIVSYELNSSKNSRLAISNEIDRLSSLIQGKAGEVRQTEGQLKKVIYEISLKQLNEMDLLLREFLQTKKL